MSVYFLFQNVTAAQTAPSNTVPPPIIMNPWDGAPPAPGSAQAYQLTVTSTLNNGSTVSCSAQPVVSNDAVNWSNYGNALTVTALATPGNTITTATGAFQYYGAYVVSISGAGASATMTVSA